MTPNKLSTENGEIDCAGRWWRSSAYEVSANHIRPAAGSVQEIYDPWAEFESVNQARQKGGRAIPRPYLSLQTVSTAFDPRESRGFAHINPDKWPILTDWCQKYGLLGLFFVEARQVDLYPRWDSRLFGSQVEGDSWPTTSSLIRTPTGWFRQQMTHLDNIEALSLPFEKKPHGSLVPREYWSPHWAEPGVLSQNERGIIRRTPLADFMPQFFPSVPNPEIHAYPTPLSSEFWQGYSESVVKFLYAAEIFTVTLRTLASLKPVNEMTDFDKHQVGQARDYLLYLSSQVNPSIGFKEDGSCFRETICTSLLASFAMMVLMDSTRGLLNLCAKCDRVFVSSAGRARFCSTRCRNAMMQSERRGRSKLLGKLPEPTLGTHEKAQ